MECCDLGARGGDQLFVGVRVSLQAPAAIGCLGQQHPRPARGRGVAGGVGDEAIGIQWPDVDLDAGYLRITQQVILIGWETEVAKPKTDGGERTISLDTGSVQVLRRWRERQNAERAATHGAWQDTGLVFTREDGNQLHPEHVADTFQRIYQEAALPPIRLHDLSGRIR